MVDPKKQCMYQLVSFPLRTLSNFTYEFSVFLNPSSALVADWVVEVD